MKRRIIIGIHGIGNKPPKAILKKWWKNSIDEGLKAIGCSNKTYAFEMVYWADLIYNKPLDSKIKDEKSPVYIKRPYIPAKSTPLKAEPEKLKHRILNRLEKGVDKIFFDDHIFIKFDAITDVIMRRLIKELDVYYHKPSLKKEKAYGFAKYQIRGRVAEILKRHKNKEILLLTHSMGTIIAYDVLIQNIYNVNINTLITIGSPLGIPIIMKKILLEQGKKMKKNERPSTPQNILRKWYNFYDIDDRVAFSYNLANDYDKNSRNMGSEDIMVNNMYECKGERSHHKSFGYLRTPEIAEKISDFLKYKKFNLFETLQRLLRLKINKMMKNNKN